MTKQELIQLKEKNYVRVAQPNTDYWLDFSKKIILGYKAKFGSQFNIIVYSKPDIETDFYIIPFTAVESLFKEESLSKDKDVEVGRRLVANIKNHLFKITNNTVNIDVKGYLANPFLAEKYDEQIDTNEYEIENKRQEIYVRIKLSLFRKKVLANFKYTCCISGITEQELLIASHIIPWNDRKDCRLDPGNDLCLSIMYDKLFDKGYFTLSDKL